ncbi:hypothetical protein GGI59_004451 [Rhizobium lentis]|uniref:Uncharacterized protein n=1 Tax=Rhizobium lentis TaxID=1138194 RepID=A0A7W8XH37_9HYPH|nr:hypothetical protein [Rhizobium lentis]MBB5552224.1 hypothetical protein [Rhizobium lentis]MBB5562762.1 hypothetical protein [Rhizobium lentis]MBB5569691.1 hypothetical protein [Rhizobium lentis]
MLPQIAFDLGSSFRLPFLYSTAKLRCTFFNLRGLGIIRDDLVMYGYITNSAYRTIRLWACSYQIDRTIPGGELVANRMGPRAVYALKALERNRHQKFAPRHFHRVPDDPLCDVFGQNVNARNIPCTGLVKIGSLRPLLFIGLFGNIGFVWRNCRHLLLPRFATAIRDGSCSHSGTREALHPLAVARLVLSSKASPDPSLYGCSADALWLTISSTMRLRS